MWYIGCHGGKKGVNNILVYSDEGKQVSDALLEADPSHPLRELRGFGFVGDSLYVVNGYKKYSQLLVFGSDGRGGYVFESVYASAQSANSMLHPYDFTVDPGQRCYVSNQDTNVVAGFEAAQVPLAVAPFLEATYPHPDRFLAGTAVASALGALPGVAQPPSDVPTPQGLQVCIMAEEGPKTGPKVVKSVRGVAFFQGFLFVADEPGDAVKVYDASGELHAWIKGHNLREPVQLLLEGTTLYIGSSGNDSVLSYDLAQGVPAGKAQPETFINGAVKSVSGMAFGSDGSFYAAERKDRKVKKFPAAGGDKGEDFDLKPALADCPEFILYVPGSL